jgi:hypothetical protein
VVQVPATKSGSRELLQREALVTSRIPTITAMTGTMSAERGDYSEPLLLSTPVGS